MNDRLAGWMFHARTVKTARPPSYSSEQFEEGFASGADSSCRFISRFGGALEVRGKSVLDVGCGHGDMCIEVVRRGAARAVGVDIQPLERARQHLHRHHADVVNRIELISTDGSLRELGEQRFDLLISKDSFEHYDDPEAFVP